MAIKVCVEYSRNSYTELSLDGPLISVGNTRPHDIAFDPAEWPGVAPSHAEIRLVNQHYVLTDLGAPSGTFLDGQRLAKPAFISRESIIQIGNGGPRIVVKEIAVEKPVVHQAAGSKGQTSLEVLAPTGEVIDRFAIRKDKVVVGRSLEVDLTVKAAASVSREHCEIYWQGDAYLVSDLGSFNGTYLNNTRITRPEQIKFGDLIKLGGSGPGLRVFDSNAAGQTTERKSSPTIVVDRFSQTFPEAAASVSIIKAPFGKKQSLTIGRALDNDIRLDGLQISNLHALVTRPAGRIVIADKGSTNGVYVNGSRIDKETSIDAASLVQVGPYVLKVDESGVEVFDNRSRTCIDVVGLSKVVTDHSGKGTIRLLDDISLTIQPNEFVGLLGPSGAGKSTLMDALNGMRPASGGQVLVNGLDLYKHLDSIKQSIGYVPQDDIIHRELTIFRTLYYVAKLRLSRDITEPDIEQIVGEVMDLTGLSERRDVPIRQLSGGQRKRVSIAVELITKPSTIYLDEPTSGLDPATEEKIMLLFRQIAESGRTVILTTHAMENVRLFDKIVVMMRGKLVFYGPPHEALTHVKAESFKELYDKLEAPISERLAKLPELPTAASVQQQQAYKAAKAQITEDVAEDWKQRFVKTAQYRQFVHEPAENRAKDEVSRAPAPVRRDLGLAGAVQQWTTLAGRYAEVLKADRFNLLILFGQAPIIALFTALVVDSEAPRDFPFFMLALVAIWFGTSVSAREIIRERAVYDRERMVNLGLFPYIGSKLLVLSIIVGGQCVLLFGTLKFFSLLGMTSLPGVYFGIPQLVIMFLTALVGISLGLFASATVKTSEIATSLVPLILIPQILFSGLVGVPKGVSRYVGVVMPATWAFDGIKRLSSTNVLVLKGKDESAEPAGNESGRGLFKDIAEKNDRMIENKDREMQEYRSRQEKRSKDYESQTIAYQKEVVKYQKGLISREPVKPVAPVLDPVPPKATVEKIPDDLSAYVEFLHPWGGILIDPLMLLIMFAGLSVASLRSLRSQDIV